jgi:hypothetical protein
MKKQMKKTIREFNQRGVQSITSERTGLVPLQMSSPMHTWPVYECLVTETWRQPGELVQLIVARRSQFDEIGAAVILVDLGCLGVKDAWARRFEDVESYRHELRDTLPSTAPFVPIDHDLAAKIVRTAIDYAGSLGFRPHRDYSVAAPFLRDAHPEAAVEDVPVGKDGQPLFINGPHDNVQKILAQLNRKVGEGNYHFVIGDPYGGLVGDELLGELDAPRRHH